jgi:hypothetical protein
VVRVVQGVWVMRVVQVVWVLRVVQKVVSVSAAQVTTTDEVGCVVETAGDGS